MAGGRIKGITVEIDGSATGLDKALKGVNSTISTSQRSLRDLNRLLKLDPTNTTLLEQKQRLLGDSINATKEKLDSLKEAQKQARAQLESGDLGQDKYDALQREIVETEQNLESLIREAAEANEALTKIGDAGKKLESVGNSVAGVGKELTAKVTTPIIGVGTAAVTVASSFDEQMSKVSAISGATGKDLESLRDKAREMGSKTKFSAAEAGSAMEYMAMAGWKTGDMLEGVEGIMNLAAASGEDLGTTSDIVTDALTALGYSAGEAGRLADVMAVASSNANTNVSLMGETFKYAASVAGAYGYSMEDVAIQTGLMANAGIKGSDAGTALRSIMSRLATDAGASSKKLGALGVMTEKLGVQFYNTDGTMRPLNDVIRDARVAWAGLSQEEQAQYANTIAGKNAMSGWLALMNAAPADVKKLEDAVYNADGTAEKMANTMQDNLSGQLTILKSQLEELAISFGEILMPAIRDIVSSVQEFVDKLNNMDDSTRETIIKIAALAAAVGPLLTVIGTLIAKVGTTLQGFEKFGKGILALVGHAKNGTGIFGKLSAAISGISAPMVAIAAVIAALVAAFVHLWNTNEEFRNNILAVWDRIKNAFSEFAQGITDRLGELGINFEGITETISAVWNGFCEVLAPVFEGAFGMVASILETLLDVMIGILDVFIGVITGDWEQAWTGIKEISSGIWEGICGIFKEVLDTLQGIADTVLGWFGTNWNAAWEGIKSVFEAAWNGITSFFSGVWEGIISIASSALEGIGNTISSAWDTITTLFTSAWDGITGIVATALDAVSATISNAWNMIADIFTTVWNVITDTVSAAWETIKNVVQVGIMLVGELFNAAFQIITIPFRLIWENCKEYLIAAWESIKMSISEALDAVRNTITTCWNAIASFLKPALDAIKISFSVAWESIKNTISTVTGAIKDTVTNVFNAIKSMVSSTFNTVKTTVISIMNEIKSVITSIWNTIKGVITSVLNVIKSTISSVFNAIKTTVTSIMNGIKSVIISIWNTVKGTMTSVLNGIKSTVSNIFNSIKAVITGVMNSIKTVISSVWNSAKSTVVGAVNNIKSGVSSGFNAAKSTVSSIFGNIKSTISEKINAAKDAVKAAIDKIKSFFNFRWSLPKLKLPHPKITGEFSLNPPSVPHFSIEWYKKAYDQAMVLSGPSIFGYSDKTGKLLAGGEGRGNEVVSGEDHLIRLISNVVSEKNTSMLSGINQLVQILQMGFPEIIRNMDRELVLDTGVWVGQTASAMDRKLGDMETKARRKT